MSYILDALNKSEQERAKKRAPGLTSLHGDKASNTFTLRHFLLILLGVVVVNLIGLYVLFENRLTAPVILDQPSVTEQKTTPHEPETVEASRPAEPIANATEVTEIELAEDEELITPPPARAKNRLAIPDFDAVSLEDLPANIRVRLPAIEVTTHIYASDSELRMVNIDDVPRFEGDILTTDFRLLEITETGIVLEFEGYAYRVNVIDDWLE
ncbi:MAG: general secretion pathway protein GspB [Pseudomonadales bacterium]|nr:general secretion pathway protein GspB [Pseudomonadales bacterium]MBO7004884.1 general secretion pathway protein GspB [Pseudomonadales bacterium]